MFLCVVGVDTLDPDNLWLSVEFLCVVGVGTLDTDFYVGFPMSLCSCARHSFTSRRRLVFLLLEY